MCVDRLNGSLLDTVVEECYAIFCLTVGRPVQMHAKLYENEMRNVMRVQHERRKKLHSREYLCCGLEYTKKIRVIEIFFHDFKYIEGFYY